MDIKMTLWSKIKEIRKKTWISQDELSKLTGIHRTYISTVESWLKNISIENIEKIAKWLWIEIKDLF